MKSSCLESKKCHDSEPSAYNPVGWNSFSVNPFRHESKLRYDRRSVGQSVVVSSTHLGPKTRFFLLSVCGLLMWGTHSDERTGLSFTIAVGPRQRSYSWVLVPWDSRPYFTVSDSRLLHPGGSGSRIYISQEQGGPFIPPRYWAPFSSPPTTQGYGGGIRTCLHTGLMKHEVCANV
jgi:hypothetical protein